jgi:hypothetical protein
MTWDYFWTREQTQAAGQNPVHRIDSLGEGQHAYVSYKANEIAGTVTQPLQIVTPFGVQFFFNSDDGLTWPQAGVLELMIQAHALDDTPLSAFGWVDLNLMDNDGGTDGQRFFLRFLGAMRAKVAIAQATSGTLVAVGL